MYITAMTLPIQLISGIILDKCGWKVPLIFVCFLGAGMLAILPYGGHLYPGLFLIKFLLMSSL